MSTDSETERQVERWVQDNINSELMHQKGVPAIMLRIQTAKDDIVK